MSDIRNPADRSWSDRLAARPVRTRGFYLRQAVLIAAALAIAAAAIHATFEHDGSIFWIVAADVLVVLACGRTAGWIVTGIGTAIGAGEGILVILLFGVMILVIPLMAPIFLGWNLVQAARARDARPGEKDGWF